MPENGTLGLTWRELETELRDGLRHRQMAKAAGKRLLPGPKITAPALDPTEVAGAIPPGYPAAVRVTCGSTRKLKNSHRILIKRLY